MRKMKIVMPLILLGLAMAMGCAKPPQPAIDEAKQALVDFVHKDGKPYPGQ